ncbi:kinase-like domain-containing protein [Mycena albidolilacea]|uniref:Kinase-like domain-containing protein n=1 Tax=Mycena albidolilacea TaxID=1033008 RepID=A0AAD6ZS77_9AGAR|nr:kinase-like domain-containing protein [Mycena albidolilacea]
MTRAACVYIINTKLQRALIINTVTMPSPAPFSNPQNNSAFPALYLYPLNDSFIPKHISLNPPGQRVKIGRQTNLKTSPAEWNGYFDFRVISRQHAEVWEENGKIFIKDVKSSNGTFVNGERLSQEGLESDPFELKTDDNVEFGVDIVGEDNKTIIYHKAAAQVACIFNEQQWCVDQQQNQGQYSQSAILPQAGAPPGSSSFNSAPGAQSDTSSEDSMYAPHGPDGTRDAPSTVQIPARLTDDSAMLSNPSSPPEELIHPEDQDTASLGYLENLLASWERRCLLSTVVAPEEDRQGLLKVAEAQITTFLTHILDSRTARLVAQELEESSAQLFVDAIQNVLDWGTLPDAKSRAKARKLMQKVVEAGEQLPSSLFIIGVNDHDEHPTFGGGFGDVYQASYDGKRVALKRIRTFTADSTTHRNRLEALVWQGLRHRFILPLLGIDRLTFAPSFCMVSPWMKYGTVLRYLQDRGRGGVNRLLLEIAQGLGYLHSLNIIHGDLRGTNILISDDGHACLSDFGLATTFSEADSTATMTSSSNRAGSARWFAPELIEPKSFGCERFVRTTASDVYAYACVCLELYTGRPPFAHLPDVAAMLRVIAGDRPEQPPVVSAALWQLVTAAWVPEPHARPSIHKIAAALEDGPETVPASPV